MKMLAADHPNSAPATVLLSNLLADEPGAIRIGPFGSALKKHEYSDAGIRVLGIDDVLSKGSPRKPKFIPEAKYDELTQYRVRPGDILVTNMGTVGRAFLVPPNFETAIISSHLIKVTPDVSRVDANYLERALNDSPAVTAQIANDSRGAIMAGFNTTRLKQLRIPLPSLPEQRRIADILDQADALRAKRRAASDHLSSLAHSIFLDMFGSPATNPKGWPRQRLGELATKFSDGPFGSNLKTSHYADEGIRVIRLQNIGAGMFLDTDKAFISEQHFASLKKHECLPGDLLVGTMGVPNLRACIQPDWLPIALNKADCVQVRPDATVCNGDYLCALLNEPETESMAHQLILGQTRLRISMGRLRELKVPVPPTTIQTAFSERLRVLQSLGQEAERSGAHFDDLFASLQHRAFRGEL